MIQILSLRTYSTQDGPRVAEKWFERGLRAQSVEDIFLNPGDYLQDVEESERYNVYYTISECLEEPGRKFLRQFHIPFDIDGLELTEPVKDTHLELTARLACEALGVDFTEVGVLFSGNGLQIIIGVTKPIEDAGYFDQMREHYRACCEKINLKLEEFQIKGRADVSVWSRARLMRYPDTLNRKPGKPERRSKILQGTILRGDFDLAKASGIPTVSTNDQINTRVAKQLFTPDSDEIMGEKGCSFLRWVKQNPTEVTEPQWYASLSVVGRFENGPVAVHEISKGHPKYSKKETDIKTRQALEASGPRTCDNINSLWGRCSTCPNFQKFSSPIAIVGENHIATMASGFYEMVEDGKGNTKRGKPDYDGLKKYFERRHEYVSVEGSPEMYGWKGKCWELIHKDYVTAFAEENFKPSPTNVMASEFYGKVKRCNNVKQDWFEKSIEGKFNLNNGIFDIQTGKLQPHSNEFGFKTVLPFDYDPEAKCPRFLKFMEEITCDRKDLQAVLQEFMGYIFAGDDPIYHKALALVGRGSNGKSTFINVIRALCGKGSYSSLSARNMMSDQKRYIVMNKLVNISEENSRDSFENTEVLMNMVSGGEITIKQLFAQPFEIRNKTKLVMLFNEMPESDNYTHGFLRRLLIVPFDANFSMKDGRADLTLEKTLALEAPGIFNYALEGYRRLTVQKFFTQSNSIDTMIEEYATENNEVLLWYKENVKYQTGIKVSTPKPTLYSSYQEFCLKIGQSRPMTYIHFMKTLKATMQALGHVFEEDRGRKEDDGSRTRGLYYVSIKKPEYNMVINFAPGAAHRE